MKLNWSEAIDDKKIPNSMDIQDISKWLLSFFISNANQHLMNKLDQSWFQFPMYCLNTGG